MAPSCYVVYVDPCVFTFFPPFYLFVSCVCLTISPFCLLLHVESELSEWHSRVFKDPHQDGRIFERKMLPWRLYSYTLNGSSFYMPGNNGSSTASALPPQSKKLLCLILCLWHVLRVLANVPATKETLMCWWVLGVCVFVCASFELMTFHTVKAGKYNPLWQRLEISDGQMLGGWMDNGWMAWWMDGW